jgi:hypothetical protein
MQAEGIGRSEEEDTMAENTTTTEGFIIVDFAFDATTPYAVVWCDDSGFEGTAATRDAAVAMVNEDPLAVVRFATCMEAADALDAGTREDYLASILS